LDPNRSKYELADLARDAVGVESIEKQNRVGQIHNADRRRR